jgi:iron complex outermembrane receptor protein
LFLVLGVGLHLSATAGADQSVTIGVWEFVGKSGVAQDKADLLADMLAEEISRLGDVRVIGKSDILTVLNLEKQKRLTGCTDESCIAEVGGALGARWVVTGNVGLLGRTYILNLKLIDTKRAWVAGRVVRKFKGGEERLLDELPEATRELFSGVAERLGLSVTERVTIAARHSQPITQSPSAVTVITREQIENTPCTDVVCLLRQVPEVDVRRMMPMYASVGARALTDSLGDKALVLMDGREINNEVFGIPFWQILPVHLEDIERIEVIRGPGSALYGANAHSLVVSIVTRQATDNTAEVFLGAGEHDRSSIRMRLGQPFGDWRLDIFGGMETSDHWRLRDLREREIGHARLRIDRQTGSASSTLQAGFIAGEGILYTALAPLGVEDAWMGHLLLGHKTDLIRAQLSFDLIDGSLSPDLSLYFGEMKLGEAPEIFDFFNSSLDTEMQINWSPFEDHLLIGGCNYRWIAFLSDDNDPGEIHQHRVGFYVHYEHRLVESLLLTLGIRFDYNNITPFTASPRFAGVWRFADKQHLRFAVGRAFRKPSFWNTSTHIKGVVGEPGFEEMGEFFQNSVGNSGLNNESITAFEAGYNGRFLEDRLQAEAVVFYNRYRDTINVFFNMETNNLGMPDLDTSIVEYRNTGRDADSLGGSISVTYHVRKYFRASLNYTLRHSWYVSEPGDSTAAILEGEKGDRILWEPAHLFNASVHYLAEAGLRLGITLHGRSSSDMAKTERGGLFDPMIVVHNPSGCFINGFAAWRVTWDTTWIEFGVRAFNIFHTGFRDAQAVTRLDGSETGGELLGRRIFLYFRGAV